MYEIGVLRSKIHYFSGYFKEARRCLERILYPGRPEASIVYKTIAYLTVVYYKLGETVLSIEYALV